MTDQFESIIGLTVEDAQKYLPEWTIRERERDGVGLAGTADYCTDRINVATENGLIAGVKGIG